MPCEPIRMKDGSVVLANMRPGARLTESDKKIIAEWIEFCRERKAKREQAQTTPLPGLKPLTPKK